MTDREQRAAPTPPADVEGDREAGWHNWRVLEHVVNWLLERDMLSLDRTEEKDGPLAAALNITDSIARLAAERDRYHDALIARHGGEPIALLAELDEARAERDALREALHDLVKTISDNTGAEPSMSVMMRAYDNARAALASAPCESDA